jgi:glycosyltransferase involved in cell wall biosynthesis
LRVLQVITSLYTGGAEKLIVDSVSLYQDKDIKMDVLTLNNNKTPFWKKLEQNNECELKGLTSKSIYNPFLIFKIIPYLKKYDVLHLHLFPTLYWVVIAKWISFSNVKLVYTEHSTNNRRRDKLIFMIMDKFIYKKLDIIICITEGVKENLERHLNIKKEIIVINNGIDVKRFYNSRKNEFFNFFAKEDFKLIQVSSFRKQKDQLTVIRSLKLLPEKVKLLLVGDGELIEENKRLVNELNLQTRVFFLGNRYDIPELINYSDVVILSSKNEGFGLVIVEGMASCKPVIASDIPGVKEIVKDNGLLFEKGNEIELAKLINMLIEDDEFYHKIARRCYARANDFDINKMIDRYILQYKKALLLKYN